MIVIDQDKFEQLLRSRIEDGLETFYRDMPNEAARIGYREGVNVAMRAALKLMKELGR